MGAGPFFLLPDVSLAGGHYRGVPSDPVFTMALGYWGDMQIELIRPENDAPSIYRGDYAVGEGLHHVCVLVDSIAEARARCEEVGAEVIFEAPVGDTGGVIYADPGTGPGTLVELLEPHVLEYPGGYTRSVGPVIGRFLTGLRDGRIEAVKLAAQKRRKE